MFVTCSKSTMHKSTTCMRLCTSQLQARCFLTPIQCTMQQHLLTAPLHALDCRCCCMHPHVPAALQAGASEGRSKARAKASEARHAGASYCRVQHTRAGGREWSE